MRIFSKVRLLEKTVSHFNFFHSSSVLYKVVQFNLSDIGEGIREVTVKDWSVKEGDKVSQFDNICVVESDKASVSITSRFDGTVKKLYYDVGDVALVGKPIVDIDVGDEASVLEESSPPETTIGISNSDQSVQNERRSESSSFKVGSLNDVCINNGGALIGNTINGEYTKRSLATPAVRRIAKEHNISLNDVEATGKDGRVLKEDILRHLGEITCTSSKNENDTMFDRKIPITGIAKAMVKTMTKANNIPTFGYSDEIDMSNLIKLREDVKEYALAKGINITFMPFFIKALSKALESYPLLNVSVDENCEHIIYKSQHNIGVAMDTNSGLIVPNIKNVQSLSVLEIGVYLKRLIEEGRAQKLGPSDLTGGTITISNIGIIGGTNLRPLILPPEVCILALGRTKLIPAFNEKGEVIKKYILNASWAADHRIIDGVTLAKFNSAWKEYIEHPNYLLMNI